MILSQKDLFGFVMKAVFNLRIAGLYHENSLLHGVESGRKGAAVFLDACCTLQPEAAHTDLAGARMDVQNPTSFREEGFKGLLQICDK